jgi:Domain of unknown function DUF29
MTTYKNDVVAWANEQANYLRAGRFELLDIENIAEEIEDVGKSAASELESRMSVLLAHLLKWQYQPDRRGNSWLRTMKEQRKRVLKRLKTTPSLKPELINPEWLDGIWADAVIRAIRETGISDFPDSCPWSMDDVLSVDWLPENFS